jgi:hypothetical protein
MTGPIILLSVAGIMSVWGLVLAVRARTWRDRFTCLALVLLNILLLGYPAVFWPCGESDCGAIVPIYEILTVVTVVSLVLLVATGRRFRKR